MFSNFEMPLEIEWLKSIFKLQFSSPVRSVTQSTRDIGNNEGIKIRFPQKICLINLNFPYSKMIRKFKILIFKDYRVGRFYLFIVFLGGRLYLDILVLKIKSFRILLVYFNLSKSTPEYIIVVFILIIHVSL